MIRRLLNALQRDLAEQIPERQFRPNELSREVARSERLRREALRAEPTARRPAQPAVEERERRARETVAPAERTRPAPVAAALRSRSQLRQALLLKEILGPPAALRWPRDRDPEV